MDHNFAPPGAAWEADTLKFSKSREVNPAEVAEINFKVRVKSDLSDFYFDLKKNPVLVLAPFIGYGGENFVFGNHAELKFISALGLKSFVRYFSPEGDPLGAGPLPPEVGRETRVWIFFNVENTFNDVTGAVISAKLPPGAEFTGRTSVFYGGKIAYDAASRAVSWEAGIIPAYAGSGIEAPAAGFEVKFTPAPSDRGKTVLILEGAGVSGTDDFTGEPLEFRGKPLHSVFEYDEEAFGKGIVK